MDHLVKSCTKSNARLFYRSTKKYSPVLVLFKFINFIASSLSPILTMSLVTSNSSSCSCTARTVVLEWVAKNDPIPNTVWIVGIATIVYYSILRPITAIVYCILQRKPVVSEEEEEEEDGSLGKTTNSSSRAAASNTIEEEDDYDDDWNEEEYVQQMNKLIATYRVSLTKKTANSSSDMSFKKKYLKELRARLSNRRTASNTIQEEEDDSDDWNEEDSIQHMRNPPPAVSSMKKYNGETKAEMRARVAIQMKEYADRGKKKE